MTEPSFAPAREDRRTRWACEENARRHHQYSQALAAWQTDAAELDWMLATARNFVGIRNSELDLKRNESAFLELVNVHIVEQPAGRTAVPGSPDFSYRIAKSIRTNLPSREGATVPGASQLKVGDAGTLVITDHRVVLHGLRNNREWAFAKLNDVGHDAHKPFTLMSVSNRQKVSGLLYDATEAPRVRFFLGLALAHFHNNIAGFTAELEQQRVEHVGIAPTAPLPARPDQAPGGGLPAFGRGLRTAYFGKAGWSRKARVLQGIATIGFTLIAGSAVASAGQPAPASHPVTRLVSTSSAARPKPSTSLKRAVSPAAKPSAKQPVPRATPASKKPAPPKTTAARTTAPPISIAPVVAPPPGPTTIVTPPPSSAPATSCYPLTNGGNCYEPGEFCRNRDHGASGVAGDGKHITCEDNDGWRWEPTG